jgi:hypothetical protein
MNKQVTVLMQDQNTGVQVSRTICALNAYSSGSICYVKKDEKDQRQSLERWIFERANAQHEMKLKLISWCFN